VSRAWREVSQPTIRDVAREAGVSRMTVSRAFSGDGPIAAVTRQRVFETARRLGYRPNQVARSLAQARTRTVGLVMYSDHWFADAGFSAEAVAQSQGYNLIQITPGGDAATERERVEVLRARRVDGLLILSSSDRRDHDYLRELHEAGVPIVTINRYCGEMGFWRLFFDYRGAVRAAARRLLAAGHRTVLFIGGAPDHPQETVRERLAGYREALREAGAWNAAAEAFGGTRTRDGEALTEAALRACPEATAMLVINDYTAAGALRALRRLNRRVPVEMAVVSLHDTQVAPCTDPALSAIRYPFRDAGRTGCQLLIGQIERRERTAGTLWLPASLVVRRSCGSGRGWDSEEVVPLS
jgi:LacI family transcriptional regulator